MKEACPTTQIPMGIVENNQEVNQITSISTNHQHCQSKKKQIEINPEVVGSYEPWMLAGKRLQRVEKKPEKETKIIENNTKMLYIKGVRTNTGSSFAILENITDDMETYPNNGQGDENNEA